MLYKKCKSYRLKSGCEPEVASSQNCPLNATIGLVGRGTQVPAPEKEQQVPTSQPMLL